MRVKRGDVGQAAIAPCEQRVAAGAVDQCGDATAMQDAVLRVADQFFLPGQTGQKAALADILDLYAQRLELALGVLAHHADLVEPADL